MFPINWFRNVPPGGIGAAVEYTQTSLYYIYILSSLPPFHSPINYKNGLSLIAFMETTEGANTSENPAVLNLSVSMCKEEEENGTNM